MATARQRSGIRGVSKLRRTLRRIEPQATEELREALREGAEAIMADAIARVPRDEGDLARSIDYKVGRDGLTAVVGPAARAVQIGRGAWGTTRTNLSVAKKDQLFQFFKGYWIEFGTKGSAAKNIPPQPARPFMTPAFDVNKQWILGRTRRGIKTALERAARL